MPDLGDRNIFREMKQRGAAQRISWSSRAFPRRLIGPAMIRPVLLFSLLQLAAFAARAEEPVTARSSEVPVIAAAEGATAFPATFIGGGRGNKPAFIDAAQSVSFAMCGVEAHGAASDLDAGLIDFNVPDLARAAGGEIEEPKNQGSTARDYHSSVVLGVTLGYRF